MRHHTWTLATLALLTLGGCETFYSIDTEPSLDHVTFDETLPLALEDLFGTCADPIVLAQDTTEIDLLAGCPDGLPSFEADGASLLHLGMVTGQAPSTVELGGEIFPANMEPLLSDVFAIELQDDDIAALCTELCEEACEELLPSYLDSSCEACHDTCEDENAATWPANRCEFFIEFDLDFGEIEMAGLDADWVTHTDPASDSWPALQLGYDFSPLYLSDVSPFASGEDPFLGYTNEVVLAHGVIDSEITCDLSWSWWFLEALTFGILDVEDLVENILLNRMPEGEHEIVLQGVDMQLWFDLDHDGESVDAELGEVSVTATSLALQPALHEDLQAAVGSFEDLLADATSSSTGGTQDMTAAGLAGAMQDGFWEALLEPDDDGSTGADQIAGGLVELVEEPIGANQQICRLYEHDDALKMTLDEVDGSCIDFVFGGVPADGMHNPFEDDEGPEIYGGVLQGLEDLTSYRALQAQRFAEVHAMVVASMLSQPPQVTVPTGLPMPPAPPQRSAEALSGAWLVSPAYLESVEAYSAGQLTYVEFVEQCTAATQEYVNFAR
jgi:hypothetical protein